MGLFEKIFKAKKDNQAAEITFRVLTGYEPVFTSWGGKIYESNKVRSAINARATHISKLRIVITGSARPKLQTRLRNAPNEWQTWGKFLYRLSTILDVHNTAFIVPVLDEFGETTGVCTVLPDMCKLVEYAGTVYLRYEFASGQHASMELDKCGIMTKYQYRDDFFGETNAALNPTMELINIQDQGISEAVKSSASYRFSARVTNWSDPKDLAKERKRFTRENLESGSGILLFPNTYDNIQQLKNTPYIVDAEQMKLIDTNVHNYFGTNEEVLQNKAYGDAWSAFYEGVPEWFAIQFSDVVTKMLFSERERANGACITATANRLQYMSNREKVLVTQTFADRGLAMIDEIRDIWNLAPLPNNEGKRIPIRGEYYNLLEGKNGNQ